RMPDDIDRQINTVGAPRRDQVLWMTFGGTGTGVADRQWRSITTVLSTTGRDMSRSEFLEFYVSSDDAAGLALVIDIGSVSEDAFYFDDLGATSGSYPGGRAWGLGLLDEEARLAQGEIWSQALDSIGLWNQDCRALPSIQQTYPLGDPRSNCTRGNGRPDTEDLNGNGVLDAEGAHFRYVVPLDVLSPYLVRDETGTGTEFRLYRIPLRGDGAIAINGASETTWRYVQHLRVTVTGTPAQPTVLGITRMRVVGSRWTKREGHGILSGPTSPEPGTAVGTVFQVGPVSRVTDGNAYASPPGVHDELQDPSSQFGAVGLEINETGLKITYDALEPDQRGEVYYRYPQQPRSLMNYRQLRLWALPRAGDWGPGGSQYLIVKLGTDARNHYLYRTPLRPPVTRDGVVPEDWLPEVIIDFDHWFDLKARAMELLLENPGQPVTVWSADSAYAVVMEDQFRAPNLSAVRELSFAVYNASPTRAGGEVWINDLRLLGAVTDAGVAGHVALDLNAGEFLGARVSYASRGGLFRQRDEDASYLGAGEFQVSATAQLGQFAPAGWGLDMPLTVSHSRTGDDPIFLQGSDIPADRLAGLRRTGGDITRVGVSLRRTSPSGIPVIGALVDATTLRLGYNARNSTTSTYESDASGVDASVSFGRQFVPRDVALLPGFVEALLRAILPAAIEESDAFARLAGARLRWNPEAISAGATYFDEQQIIRRFDRIVTGPGDAAATARESPRQGLENAARLALRPLTSLQAEISLTGSRNLLAANRASGQPRQRQAIENARGRLAGMDIGWETNRAVTSSVGYRPQIASWLQPGISYTSRFRADRNASFIELLPGAGPADSVAVL
ncbi:MAG TPA: hypothetical protein VNZ57_08625, partial [Longimicrobiales bacterium]|nr:hypothetical protein [Longimicrobiales bacterium]